jgi:Fe-S oxidoreductase
MRLLQLGQVEEAMTHPTTWECASCYTCETTCPKGLSPAHVHRTLRTVSGNGHAHGHALRTWMLTHVDELWRLGNALRPLSTWAMRLPGAGLLNEGLLGIHRRRALPPLAQPTFPRWFARRTPGGDGHRGRAVLFHDTFMDYNYPGVGIALTELLERAGFRVELADMVCCGRAMISKALLAPAAERARTNVERLFEQVRDGAPIVGCEPSCLLSLREEYPQLVEPALRGRARVVAARARLADELLADLAGEGELEVEFRPADGAPRPVLFHAHCHHKASARPQASLELLRRAGYDAELLDTACCGMAGSYGFEKEHYEASRRAGERALFPLLRARPEAQVAITGMSCRQQVEHFTGRPTRHVVELLREAAV